MVKRLGVVWITTSTLLMMHFAATSIALADSSVRYTPPGGKNPERTVSGGQRGRSRANCQLASGRSLDVSLLVPSEARHGDVLTTLSQPRFYWYATGEGATTAEFTLTELETGNVIVQKQVVLKPGLGSIQVPETAALKMDQDYVWSLLTACDPYGTDGIYARSFVRWVAVPGALTEALQASTNAQEEGAAYARFGIWYDALSALIESPGAVDAARLLLEQGQVANVRI